MKKSDLYYTKPFESWDGGTYNIKYLTPLGQELLDKAKQVQKTYFLDIREVTHEGYKIRFQVIDIEYDIPNTHEIEIEKLPESIFNSYTSPIEIKLPNKKISINLTIKGKLIIIGFLIIILILIFGL